MGRRDGGEDGGGVAVAMVECLMGDARRVRIVVVSLCMGVEPSRSGVRSH